MKIGCQMMIEVVALVTVAVSVGAAAPVRVAYAGRVVTTTASVVRSAAGTLVPLRAATQALGGHVEWDRATRRAVVRHGGRRLEVDEGTHAVRLDGKPLAGLTAPRRVQGQLLVPLVGVERLFGVRGRWLPRQKLLSFAALPGGGGGGGQETGSQPATPGGDHPATGVQLRLTSDRRAYAVGDSVVLTLTVINAGPSPVTLQFSSGQKYDFEVRRGGQVVWRWSADRMFTQALTSMTLGPRERKVFTETWKQQDNNGQPVGAGTYEAVAVITTMGGPRPQSPPLTLRIGS
jgi:hypothetical protein